MQMTTCVCCQRKIIFFAGGKQTFRHCIYFSLVANRHFVYFSLAANTIHDEISMGMEYHAENQGTIYHVFPQWPNLS